MYVMSHKARFEKYRDDTVILKSEQFAKWTLPQLMADLRLASNGSSLMLERDYQEIGALLINNLAAKLASILFPTNRPFYRIEISEVLKEAAKSKGLSDAQLQASLARLEMDSCQLLFINASYNQLVMALKYLIATGNVLMYRDSETKRTLAYGLQSYVVLRDGKGRTLDIVLREFTQFAGLSPDMQKLVRAKHPHRYGPEAQRENNCELYTRIERQNRKDSVVYVVTQEVEGIAVEGEGVYPEHLCPWQAVTWSLIAGEHYGRGLVEDYAGGFAKLSDFSQALALYGISTMKVVNLVAPGSGSDIDALNSAETGEYVQGSPDAIKGLETGDAQKIVSMQSQIADVFQNLARAFMWSGNTRDAERVTMYELRQNAMEAETTLGGTYSVLSEGMQIPLAHLLLAEMSPEALAGLISGDMALDIMAGIPALGRSSDVQNLLAAAQEAGVIIPALSQLSKRIDPERILDLIMAGQSVDTTQIYKSEEQQTEEADAENQMNQGQAQIQDSQALLSATQQLQQI